MSQTEQSASVEGQWETYVHRHDESVRYQARRVGSEGSRYELRDMDGADGGDIDAGFFEAVYELYVPKPEPEPKEGDD